MFTLIDTSKNNKHFMHTYTLADMHNELLKLIKKFGTIAYIRMDNKIFKTIELEFVNSIVEYPQNTDIPRTSRWQSKAALDIYANEIITDIIPHGFTYTYGSLMKNPYNQVEKVINMLNENPTTRQATIMLGDYKCLDDKEPPCCRIVDLKYRNDKLNMNLVFRSHDITAYYPNLYAFAKLQKIIADKINMQIGAIRCTSESLHLYEGDINLLNEIED